MNYKETHVAGSKYRRFPRVVIENPKDAAPMVVCVEQEVLTLADDTQPMIRDVGNLVFPFDPAASYDLLDPLTGQPTGKQLTGADVYAGVWSIVMHQAMARDAAAEAEAAA